MHVFGNVKEPHHMFSALIRLLAPEPKRNEARETEKILTTANVMIFAAQMQATVPAQEFPAVAFVSAQSEAKVFLTRWTRFQVTVWVFSLSINTTVGVGIPRFRPSSP